MEGGGDLLMMSLPHQQKIITKNKVTAHKSKVLKGMMAGYTGNTWTFDIPLTTITWGAPRSLPEGKGDAVRASLAGDIAGVSCCGDDPYFGGKQMAVLARLYQFKDISNMCNNVKHFQVSNHSRGAWRNSFGPASKRSGETLHRGLARRNQRRPPGL